PRWSPMMRSPTRPMTTPSAIAGGVRRARTTSSSASAGSILGHDLVDRVDRGGGVEAGFLGGRADDRTEPSEGFLVCPHVDHDEPVTGPVAHVMQPFRLLNDGRPAHLEDLVVLLDRFTRKLEHCHDGHCGSSLSYRRGHHQWERAPAHG